MFIIPIYLFSEIFPGESRGPICSSCTRAHSPVWPPLISNMSNYVTISVYWVKLGSVPIGTLRKLSSPPVPPVLPPEWSPRPPSERGTRPPTGLATENDLYDNNRSVSFGFVGFCSVSFGFVRFRSVSFGFVEKGNPPGPKEETV